jgi:hypothetical protein
LLPSRGASRRSPGLRPLPPRGGRLVEREIEHCGQQAPRQETSAHSREAAGSFSAARISLSCANRPRVGHRIMGRRPALRRSVSKLSEPLLPPQSSERYSARAPTPRRLPHALQVGMPQLSRRHPIGTRRKIRPKFDRRNRARRYGSAPLPTPSLSGKTSDRADSVRSPGSVFRKRRIRRGTPDPGKQARMPRLRRHVVLRVWQPDERRVA